MASCRFFQVRYSAKAMTLPSVSRINSARDRNSGDRPSSFSVASPGLITRLASLMPSFSVITV